MRPVLILSGPPGSGKTTAARAIAGAASLGVHVESDRFFHFVDGGYVEPWLSRAHAQNTVVMRAVAASAAAYADGGYLTVIDGIISPAWFLTPLREALTARGHRVAYAILRPSLTACIARVSSRHAPELSDPGVVRQLYRDFTSVGPLEDHVLDVEDLGVTRVTAELTARFDAGILDL